MAVLRWKEHNQKDVDEMAEVVGCIRLGRFTMREMFTTVQPSGLFTYAQILGGLRVLNVFLNAGTSLELFDYSNCRGHQFLVFPTIPIRSTLSIIKNHLF